MAWVLIVAGRAFPRVVAVVAGSLLPIGWLLRMAAFLQFHVAKLMACPLGSWGVLYAIYDIHASALVRVLHNNPQQSLPLVAGTAKTLRLFGRPCAGRYADTTGIQETALYETVSYRSCSA